MHRPLVGAVAALALAGAAALAASAAAADEVPQYDIGRYCAASFGNYVDKTQSFLFDTCISTETDKRQKLSKVWGKIPADIHKTCSVMMGGFKEGSYVLLSSCALSLYAARWFDGGGSVE